MLNLKRLVSLFAIVLLVLPATATPSRANESEVVRLSLNECLEMALANNLDLVSARKDPQIAELRINENSADFDGTITVSSDFTQLTSDQTITDLTSNQSAPGSFDRDDLRGRLAWSQLLGYGATYDVTLGAQDTEQLSRQINAIGGFQDNISNNLAQSLTLNYNMPLLRGFGKEPAQVNVLLARSGLDISNEDFRLRAIQTLKSTEDAYWDLLAFRAAYDVAQESLKLAEDLYEQNKKKVEVGSLAPIDVTQAEAGVASREEDVIVAEIAVRNAEDNLRRLLAIPPNDPMWLAVLEPTDRASYEERAVDFQAAIAVALESRPEIINARQSLRDSELSERVAKNGARHSLDLNASFTPSSGDNDQRFESPPGTLISDTNTDSDADNWSVGLTYGYTIGNKRAKANYAIAQINREKSEISVRNVEQDIRVDVRAAARAVTSGAKRVAAARANTVLQRKNVEAEQKKFENGMTTSFEVLRIQTDLSDAQVAEIRAVLDYTKALADLERAKGTLLEARGLQLGP